jgi:hypothetical protein
LKLRLREGNEAKTNAEAARQNEAVEDNVN